MTESISASSPPPSRPSRLYWEDFEVGTVREFGRYEVTREAVLEFAARFDPQPFHLDDAAAAKSLFGRLAASGWHTAAMAMRMMCEGYLLEAASLGSPAPCTGPSAERRGREYSSRCGFPRAPRSRS